MSDNDDNNDRKFTNEETLKRRAWIARALDCVRRRQQQAGDGPDPAPEQSERPQLYVVPSRRQR